jgi:DNA-binding response OmpR family regulator
MVQEPYVLVADDDPLMIKSLQIILKGAGFRVVTVSDGLAAIEQMRAERPALALLDIMMPRLDGLDVCRTVRADAELRDLKLFLLTARAMPRERQQGLDAGADDYITKPFAKADLLARVRSVMPAPKA